MTGIATYKQKSHNNASTSRGAFPELAPTWQCFQTSTPFVYAIKALLDNNFSCTCLVTTIALYSHHCAPTTVAMA